MSIPNHQKISTYAFFYFLYIKGSPFYLSTVIFSALFSVIQELRRHLDEASLLILNRGAHFAPSPFILRELKATFRFLRFMYPNKLIIFRNTVPGHQNCSAYSEPLTKQQELRDGTMYSWSKFREQNQLAKNLAELFGIVYMDVDAQTQFRADGHFGRNKKGTEDCLHYCMPGPIDTWVQLLYNMLRMLVLT